jgi:hypothetical protein
MSIGPLTFILGWMTMEWFILSDDDYSKRSDSARRRQTDASSGTVVAEHPTVD